MQSILLPRQLDTLPNDLLELLRTREDLRNAHNCHFGGSGKTEDLIGAWNVYAEGAFTNEIPSADVSSADFLHWLAVRFSGEFCGTHSFVCSFEDCFAGPFTPPASISTSLGAVDRSEALKPWVVLANFSGYLARELSLQPIGGDVLMQLRVTIGPGQVWFLPQLPLDVQADGHLLVIRYADLQESDAAKVLAMKNARDRVSWFPLPFSMPLIGSESHEHRVVIFQQEEEKKRDKKRVDDLEELFFDASSAASAMAAAPAPAKASAAGRDRGPRLINLSTSKQFQGFLRQYTVPVEIENTPETQGIQWHVRKQALCDEPMLFGLFSRNNLPQETLQWLYLIFPKKFNESVVAQEMIRTAFGGRARVFKSLNMLRGEEDGSFC
jgi:hypothetical protein